MTKPQLRLLGSLVTLALLTVAFVLYVETK